VGKSVSWVTKWKDRIDKTDEPNFKMYLSQSRALKHILRETPQEVKEVIAQMRVELSEGCALFNNLKANIQKKADFCVKLTRNALQTPQN